MMRCFNLILLLWSLSLPATAQWMGDAFGLFDPTQEPERAGWAGLQTWDDLDVTIGPGPVTDLALFMGEKSMTANQDQAMAMTIGLDARGNLMADGQTAQFSFSSDQSILEAQSEAGIAHVLLDATTEAGLYEVGVELGGIQSERQVYRQNADVGTTDLAWSSRQLQTASATLRSNLETAPMEDANGNRLRAGFGVQFHIVGADGTHALIPATVLKGSASALLPTAYLDGPQTAEVVMGAESGGVLTMDIDAIEARGRPILRNSYDAELGLLYLTWGPVATSTGALLPDGTSVEMAIEMAQGEMRLVESWIQAGTSHVSLLISRTDLPAEVTVTSLVGSFTYAVAP